MRLQLTDRAFNALMKQPVIAFGLILLLSGTLLLGACNIINIQDPNNSGNYSTESYSVSAPSNYSYAERAPSDEYFYFGYPDTNPSGLRAVEIYDFNKCPNLGISQLQFSKSQNASWGRIDAWDTSNIPGFETSDELWDSPCKNIGYPESHTIYAFCAEKDGKAVAICIQQMTDDEEMAKQIFESFRWIR